MSDANARRRPVGASPRAVIAVEAQIGTLARAQHGIISRAQLLEAGLTPAAVRWRLQRAHLRPIHRGVYAVADPALLRLSAESAALIATGPESALSHRTAAALWGIAPAAGGAVHVLVTGESLRRHGGVVTHRVARLGPVDLATHDNLRLTAPARTVIDFATDAPLSEVERALSEGRALKLISDTRLAAALYRLPRNYPGAAKIRALLRRQVGRVITRSERERTLLALLEAAGLPKPLVNVSLRGYVPDFYWPDYKLALEFDGFGTHGSRPSFERDRKRDQVLATLGIQTIRATWLQLEHEPVALVVRIGQALAARAVRGA